MWHEARKQEKNVKKAIVDYRKRAERRHDYYEKIKQDPVKFMQVHGQPVKIHFDESGKIQSEHSTAMMPWQGDKSQMIDRYDARSLLDFIREVKSKPSLNIELDKEERKCNYERYRVIVYNKHKQISEKEHLRGIEANEMYGDQSQELRQKEAAEATKKQLSARRVQIGYNYGDDDPSSSTASFNNGNDDNNSNDEDEDETSDIEAFINGIQDIPLEDDHYTSTILDDLSRCSLEYGMTYDDFAKRLKIDQEIQEKKEIDQAIEIEKQKMAGKQSRRQRRMLKDELLKNRKIERLSYAKYDSDQDKDNSDSDSTSSSSSDSSDEEDFEGKTKRERKQAYDKLQLEAAKNSTSLLSSINQSSSSASSARRSSPRPSSNHYSSSNRRYDSDRYSSSSSSRRYDDYHNSSGSSYYSRRRSRSRSPYSSHYYENRRRRSRSSSPRREYGKHSSSGGGSVTVKPLAPRGSVSSSSSKIKKPISVAAAAASGGEKKLTPQEKLKIRMQRALKKQLKADRSAAAEKRAQEYQSQLERADQLREISKKMNRRPYDQRRRSPDWNY